jgi:Xaa-Pro aminopeptidase
MTEFERKQAVISDLLAQHGLEALVLCRVSSFAWATGGAASYVNTAASEGAATLVITPAGRYVVTNNIEAPRLEQEEHLSEQGWEFRVTPWHEAQDVVGELTRGLKVGADVALPGAHNLAGELARRRSILLPEEQARFRTLGRQQAEAMDAAIRSVRPGQTEHEIAARLAFETERRGIQCIVNLIATDERIFAFRHPLPTDKRLESYAMLVACGRQRGLVCSCTRLVHFGRLPDDVRRKAEAVAHIDAVFLSETRPGRTLGEVLRTRRGGLCRCRLSPTSGGSTTRAGLAGYEPRERYRHPPGLQDVVAVGQAYAWNPSITGAKSEDTILVGAAGNEILTEIPGWPTIAVTLPGQSQPIQRPAILELP